MTSFGSYYQYQSIKNNSKIIMTHILMRWNGKKYSSYPSTNEYTPAEHVAPNILSIGLK